MVYFGWYLVNPHVQRIQNMYGKGGREYLRPSYGQPKLTLVSRFVTTVYVVQNVNNDLYSRTRSITFEK